MRNIIFSLLFYISATTLFADPYIIKATQPAKLFTILVDDMSGPERTMIGTLQGVIADSEEEQIYIRLLAGGYDTWLNDLVDNYNVERIDETDAMVLLNYFKDTLNGYILYQIGHHKCH